tara:strand:+ start:190 stop:351 length:162 start_codon:yes stop_codon:yes gene_type:complete
MNVSNSLNECLLKVKSDFIESEFIILQGFKNLVGLEVLIILPTRVKETLQEMR